MEETKNQIPRIHCQGISVSYNVVVVHNIYKSQKSNVGEVDREGSVGTHEDTTKSARRNHARNHVPYMGLPRDVCTLWLLVTKC